MTNTTTIRVSIAARDALRDLAANESVSSAQLIERLIRRERQRQIGMALAAREPDADEQRWMESGAAFDEPLEPSRANAGESADARR